MPRPSLKVKPVPSLATVALTLATALLSACAGYSPGKVQPGMSAAEVETLMGAT